MAKLIFAFLNSASAHRNLAQRDLLSQFHSAPVCVRACVRACACVRVCVWALFLPAHSFK